MESSEGWDEATLQARRKQRKVAWKDSYARIYGMAPTQRQQDETGATVVTEVQCLFCLSFGREDIRGEAPVDENSDESRRRRKKSSNVKHFVTFRPDQFTQHLTREHPTKWAAYQLIRQHPDTTASFFPEPAAPSPPYDESYFFRDIPPVIFNPSAPDAEVLAFHEYAAEEFVLGKPMHEWCRFAVSFGHAFRAEPSDAYGDVTARRPWHVLDDPLQLAKRRIDAAFEFMQLLGVRFYTFADTDVVPDGQEHLWESIVPYLQQKQSETSVRLLWATANMMANRKYMHGAATSPSLAVFLEAAAQVKRAMRVTHLLGGEAFVLSAGREGYQSLVGINLAKEDARYAIFLRMVVEYRSAVGATYQLLLEPKPREPLRHQYNYDAATTLCFLHRHHLQQHFKLNVVPAHGVLAGHDYAHEVAYAAMTKCLGSLSISTGDRADAFLTDPALAALLMRTVIQHQGIAPGGLNLSAKVRRESTSLRDMVAAHIGAMDAVARGLRKAAGLYVKGDLDRKTQVRYASWESPLGRQIESGEMTFDALATKSARREAVVSGELELFELLFQRGLA
ncbi:xylose isomerase 1 [Achlya hypogyna]|uniref:Xylose isomerase n=1 Tax=Achlya hypogyna TaxID=1202772 RepID=A0A1V9ZE43_ACHHY|nr:xylose isomerase 1 [Achlya hypogyna]